jgi:hypothetical protein
MKLGCADGLTRFFDPQELYGSQTFAFWATNMFMFTFIWNAFDEPNCACGKN